MIKKFLNFDFETWIFCTWTWHPENYVHEGRHTKWFIMNFVSKKIVWYTPALNPSNGFSIFSLHDRMIMRCQPTSCAIMQHDICTTKTIPKISNRHSQNKTKFSLFNSREDGPDPNSGPHVPRFWEPQVTCSMSEKQWRNEIPTAEGKPGSPGRDGKLQLGNVPLAWVNTTWIILVDYSIHVCVKVWWK